MVDIRDIKENKLKANLISFLRRISHKLCLMVYSYVDWRGLPTVQYILECRDRLLGYLCPQHADFMCLTWAVHDQTLIPSYNNDNQGHRKSFHDAGSSL